MALAASALVLVHVLPSHLSRFSLNQVISTSKYVSTHFYTR